MDLTTTYMGLTLGNPVVAGASPLSGDLAGIKRLAEAGAGAIVLHSIFEEQLAGEAAALDYYLEQGTERFGESLSYFPQAESYKVGPEAYLEKVAAAVEVVDVPVIASINGVSAGGWTDYAARLQAAGAAGLELNICLVPTNPAARAEQIEKAHLSILRAVKAAVSIPVAVKLSPYFSATANMARRLDEAGADALVLFNRFYQPDVDLDALAVSARLALSTSDESRLPLRWIAILAGRVRSSLAAATGIHTGADAAKLILVGADVVQMVSALLIHGVGRLAVVRDELAALLEKKGYASVAEARGVLSMASCAEPAAFERANYIKTLTSYTTPWQTV